MTTINREKVAEAIKLAEHAAAGMKQASAGKPPEHVTTSDAKTFAGLSVVLQHLVTAARQDQLQREQMTAALNRIANLKVRGAGELIEQKNWQKLLTEVQSVAQDALEL